MGHYTVDEGEAQVYVVPMSGGEAVRVTNVERGVRSYAWRPDRGALAFVTTDVPEEREGEERHNKSFEVGDRSEKDARILFAPVVG